MGTSVGPLSHPLADEGRRTPNGGAFDWFASLILRKTGGTRPSLSLSQVVRLLSPVSLPSYWGQTGKSSDRLSVSDETPFAYCISSHGLGGCCNSLCVSYIKPPPLCETGDDSGLTLPKTVNDNKTGEQNRGRENIFVRGGDEYKSHRLLSQLSTLYTFLYAN